MSITNDDLEEERSIAFVGVTRAINKLHITYSDSRLYFGKFVKTTSSRFIDEGIF